ncbi:MAG: sigma-70 family RNA polymerase sigma factor [Atopobiaceae bacterium]|nr:sigma-70 family RNA polymerase sigma factor [Atopobiaceae bacterium]
MGFSIAGNKLAREDLDGLFTEYYPRIFNYIYYRTLNAALADDLVGTVMLNIVRGYATFDARKGNLDAWVFRVARNALFSHFRKARDVMDVDSVSEKVFSYEDEDALDERGTMVRKLLEVLSDDERELVYLKYWEELSNKEVSERLGINASTVSTKLWRANEKMRKAQRA